MVIKTIIKKYYSYTRPIQNQKNMKKDLDRLSNKSLYQ